MTAKKDSSYSPELSDFEYKALSKLLHNKTILITGGSGSFGTQCVRVLLDHFQLRRIIIFSRGEERQYHIAQSLKSHPKFNTLRFFIGDIRDRQRLCLAFREVNFIIHTAALKQVDTAEYNPSEAIKTNIVGTQNVLDLAVQENIQRVIVLSTDKAVSPCNLYGATKMVAERITIAANNVVGMSDSIFSLVRYGNVIGSSGSVFKLFLKAGYEAKELPITNLNMTRFLIRVRAGVFFTLKALLWAQGGEIFIPRLPSLRIKDLAIAMAPKAKLKEIGVRPGEKIHECLIDKTEMSPVYAWHDRYIIVPSSLMKPKTPHPDMGTPQKVFQAGELVYSSEDVTSSLTHQDIRRLVTQGMSEFNNSRKEL